MVEKCPANPLFVEEYFADPPKRWEARLDNVYPSVIYDVDLGIFKCWYKSFIYLTRHRMTRPSPSAHSVNTLAARVKRASYTRPQ